MYCVLLFRVTGKIRSSEQSERQFVLLWWRWIQ